MLLPHRHEHLSRMRSVQEYETANQNDRQGQGLQDFELDKDVFVDRIHQVQFPVTHSGEGTL